MITLFKKQKETTKELTIDEQIYKDVYSAQELLLREAREILSKPFSYDKERYDRLQKLHDLGFSRAEEVKEFKELDDKRKEQDELRKKIEYYNVNYPLNKFIDKDIVEKICNKYGLLLTRVSDYIAEIPEKNQDEIINFKVRRKDTREPTEIYSRFWMPSFYFPRFDNAETYEAYQNEKIEGKEMLIIAPEHKLDTRGKEKDGYKLKIKDPIVLQPVDKGYLIITSWGLEASDELVVNSINN